MDQGSTMKRSAVHNFAPTVTKFCVMWEGQALPHDTKFGNSRCEIVGRRVIFIWSLIHGLRWSGLIKAEPELFPNCLTPYHPEAFKPSWIQYKSMRSIHMATWCVIMILKNTFLYASLKFVITFFAMLMHTMQWRVKHLYEMHTFGLNDCSCFCTDHSQS